MDTITHSLSVRLANWLNRYVHREGLEYEKVVLGAEIFLINIPKLLLIFTLSALLGVFYQTILVLIGFNCLRRTAFGLHASNNISCSIVSVCLFVIAPFLIQDYAISNYIVLIVFAGILPVLYLFAPSDTEARPILGAKKRAKLKKKTLFSGLALLALVLVVQWNDIKLFLTLGAVYEAVSILPVTYKFLKRSRNNYEAYENGELLI